jgi:hypothetical protein
LISSNTKAQFLKAAKAPHFDKTGLAEFDQFKKQLHYWIHSSVQPVCGLPKKYYVVSGITDAFNQTYGLYRNVGVFDGEYGYHSLVLGDRVTTDLSKADCIIVSHPFSATGMCAHHLLSAADRYGVPIIVDCAFFGICRDISFDFSLYRNIHSVCFSLSKSMGTGLNRVGLLYTKDKYPVSKYTQWGYPFLSAARHHYSLISQIGPDDMVKKYRDIQEQICEQHGLIPSNTVIFGLDYTSDYNEFDRGGVNRLCLTEFFEESS